MPFVLNVSESPKVLLVSWSGTFSKADNMAYQEMLNTLPEASLSLPRFHDVRNVSMDIEMDEIRKTKSSVSGKTENSENLIKSAVLVHGDLEYGMMRVFAALYQHPKLDIQVFRDLGKAASWLGLKFTGDPFEQMTGK